MIGNLTHSLPLELIQSLAKLIQESRKKQIHNSDNSLHLWCAIFLMVKALHR